MSATVHSSHTDDHVGKFRAEFDRLRQRGEIDDALGHLRETEPALADLASYDDIEQLLRGDDFERNDSVLIALLRHAAGDTIHATAAAWMVAASFLRASKTIARRVLRATRSVLMTTDEPRRGVRGQGVSGSDTLADIEGMVLGVLWERVRSYPLHRTSHVAANLVRDTHQLTLRTLGIYGSQSAADVVSFDDRAAPAEALTVSEKTSCDSSQELLELLAWAVQEQWLDEQSALILGTRYFGADTGHHGVVTDDRIGELLGLSQPTISRRRAAANRKLLAAAEAFPGPRALQLAS